MRKKYVVVTGWVISGIGKWVTTACAGFFFSENYKITPIKLDWYLNIDPGTMNPHEHGEVYVLADGGEVDMDFGHYERFMWWTCSQSQSISMGKIYAWILEKERRWDFLGKTVQMIPHVTDHICERIEEVFTQKWWDICMIEVWWTVWDIEVELYLEAIRQMRRNKNREDFLHIHLTYVPIPWGVDEQKTKPTQQSINLLQSRWLFPDIVIARGKEQLTQDSIDKIALFSNLRDERVFSIPDVDCIYKIPELLALQNFDRLIYGKLCVGYDTTKKLKKWRELYTRKKLEKKKVAIIGKYTALEDSYSSVVAALEHVGFHQWLDIEIQFLDARKSDVIDKLEWIDACIVPGWFWNTAIENIIHTLTYIRENKIPCLGICLWMQLMAVEFIRNVLWNKKANSLEFDKSCTPNDVVTLLEEQKDILMMWWTMRLWEQMSILSPWIIFDAYNAQSRIYEKNNITERFRHRYEINPNFTEQMHQAGLKIAWKSREDVVQFIEMDSSEHPYYVWTQSHPELSSRLLDPSPLFFALFERNFK